MGDSRPESPDPPKVHRTSVLTDVGNKIKDGVSSEYTLRGQQNPCRIDWAEHWFRHQPTCGHAFQQLKLGSELGHQKPCASGIDRQV